MGVAENVTAQWWTPPGVMFAEIVAHNARRSAQQRREPEVVHNHQSGRPCSGGCVMVWPSGQTKPFAFTAEPRPILGPDLTAALEANRQHGAG